MASTRQTTLEERLMIVNLAAQGCTDPEIAARLGWAVRTVRKWRCRGALGREALVSRFGRPRTGACVAESPRERMVREQVLRWRQQHPGWGPKTLRAELERQPDWACGRLPSRATLARLLREHGLTRAYQRHSSLPVAPRATPTAAHEEWEMDARGHAPVPDLGVVTLVHVNDRCSHARLLSYPFCLGAQRAQRHLNTEDYQLALRLAFHQWGLPDRLAVDHDSVFADNDTPSPFPTRFHLWLLALGVELVFNRVRRPTDQGMTERSHQVWAAQVLEGQRFKRLEELVAALHARRSFLNEHLPCRSLREVPPLVAHPEARSPRRHYRPEIEFALLEVQRAWEYLGRCQWFRRVSQAHTFSLGGQVYYLGGAWSRGRQVEITADANERCLRVQSDDGTLRAALAVRGLTEQDLMGDLAQILTVPGYQPSLPLFEESERLARLCETLCVTT